MDALTALRSRRSIRRYSDQPVSREQLETIVDCARLAATARNEQPWEFVVVTDPATRARLAEICEYGKFFAVASAVVVVLCRDGKYYLEDGAAATQNLLVAAAALGLGSCWVAGDKKPYADEIRILLGAPAELKTVSLVAIGHPAETPTPAKRVLAEVLHWERF
jgi:nitroreductase